MQPVPPGARFSKEWGTKDSWPIPGTIGNWIEYSFDFVRRHIEKEAGSPDLGFLEKEAISADEQFDVMKAQVLSRLSQAANDNPNDTFVKKLLESTEKLRTFDAADFVRAYEPKGKQMSRDMLAIEAGFETPPHFSVLADVAAIRSPFEASAKLAKLAQQAGSHLSRVVKQSEREERIGTNVFIGHGRSKVWRDLKDFLQDRVRLPWDEFNRVPVAGVTNIARLSQMLDAAAIAFLVLTAEDERADGKMQARMNVLHEAGLFQGRLGFERAIVLLEDGCEEFSNIQGLGQIRFPEGNVSAVFEEIRRVLERENLIEDEKT